MPIAYRPARAQDLERADELVVASINDLTMRYGFGKMASSRPPQFQMFSLKDDPDGLWVAEDAGQILGFAWSCVCGDLWFLAQLFVSPDRQGHGIGNELLKRTWGHAKKNGATNKALITFTCNTVSQGLYMRHGMFPRFPIYIFSVARERLAGRLQGAQLRSVPIKNPALQMENLVRIDVQALGVSREKHHRYLASDSATRQPAARMLSGASALILRACLSFPTRGYWSKRRRICAGRRARWKRSSVTSASATFTSVRTAISDRWRSRGPMPLAPPSGPR